LLDKLIELIDGLGWPGDRAEVPTSADRSWTDYTLECSGAHALEYLTTLPQTTQHDEVAFLTTIHIGECCFAAMHACVAAAISSGQAGQPLPATRHLECAKSYADAFDLAFTALVTMSSQQFRRFVATTGQASAVQSRRYQQLESLIYGLHPAKEDAVGLFPELAGIRPGPELTLKLLLRGHLGDREFEPLVGAARSLDGALYRWRARHLGAANRLYPFTGLELGSDYLGSHYSQRLSALWDLEGRR
jgi:tryptophan 2,3-dioxygenase